MSRAPEFTPSWLPRQQRVASIASCTGSCSTTFAPFATAPSSITATASSLDVQINVVVGGQCCLSLVAEEAVAHAMFELAVLREAVPRDRRALCALIKSYMLRSQASDA
jgi:hypothetical protein